MKLCILAAGKGSRIKAFGQQLHKALLPVGNKAVISRVIDQFPQCDEIVIALGYRGQQIREYLSVAHPEEHFTFVDVDPWEGPGSGPGYSIWCCREHLQTPFIFSTCDTILNESVFPTETNWIGIAPTEEPEKWCTVSMSDGCKVEEIIYKASKSHEWAFIGTSFVRDVSRFWDAMERHREDSGEIQVMPGLEALKEDNLKGIELAWIDTGTDANYFAALNLFDKNMTFEGKTSDVTYRFRDKILKFFPNSIDAEQRFKRGQLNQEVFAPVESHVGNFFSYQFIEGTMLSSVIDAAETERVLGWLEDHLWEDLECDDVFLSSVRSFYLDKSLDRLTRYEATLPDGKEIEILTINGLDCPSIRSQLSSIADSVWDRAHASRFHGDLHDDNIVVTPDGGFRLIDWRQSFGGSIEVGDRTYDLAKFLHTLEFSVASMERADFTYRLEGQTLEIGHKEEPRRIAAERAFWAFVADKGYDADFIKLVDAICFINMAPLYDAQMGAYLYALGRHNLTLLLDRTKGMQS